MTRANFTLCPRARRAMELQRQAAVARACGWDAEADELLNEAISVLDALVGPA